MENNTYAKKRVKDYFESEEKANQEILDQIRLQILFMDKEKTDTYILAKKLPKDLYIDLISYFDGDCIRLPTVEDFIQAELLAPIYFLRQYKNKSWVEIRKILDIDSTDENYKASILAKKVEEIDNHIKTVTKVALTNYVYERERK